MSNRLVQSGEDYVLPLGESCWITVGSKTLFISYGCDTVELYTEGDEMADPEDTLRIGNEAEGGSDE